ncbi:hypothetical protein DN402_34005 [Streptomyces sp. SW4]|nr:hypothetical protein DN402_34005 [Streptomyces sp. SW4]
MPGTGQELVAVPDEEFVRVVVEGGPGWAGNGAVSRVPSAASTRVSVPSFVSRAISLPVRGATSSSSFASGAVSSRGTLSFRPGTENEQQRLP